MNDENVNGSIRIPGLTNTDYLYNMNFRLTILPLLLTIISLGHAQVVTLSPFFATPDEPVTIYFDASKGDGGLAEYDGTIYAHTGLITTESATPGDWKNVQGVWGTADPNVKMTRIFSHMGERIYKLSISSIYDFYGATPLDTILQLAFVFRNETGSVTGRDIGGGDIFVDLYPPGLNIAIREPEADPFIIDAGENLRIKAIATHNDSMFLDINGVNVLGINDSNLIYNTPAAGTGLQMFRVTATSATESISDSAYFFVRDPVVVEPVPAGMLQGINYIDDSTATLVLYAPEKNYVFVVGEFNNWELSDAGYMKVDPDSATYWVTLTGLTPGQEYAYQYLIDGTLYVADPLAEKVLDPWNDASIPEENYPDLRAYPEGRSGIVSVLQTAQPAYNWAVTDFVPVADKDLVIYELLIRDFTAARNYQTLTDTLQYLKALGVNAIELMPVMEFEGNESWGYNPSFFIALDKYYGTRENFKIFIDSCHANGIAVILDIAMNHAFGQCPLVQMWWDPALNVPAANSPYFNQYPTHDYNVGYDFNHESPATINFRNRVFTFWMHEFHVDGYRFDLSKGYTQNNTLGDVNAWGAYDASRIATWENIGDTLWQVNPAAKLILEHFAANTEETELSNYGFMLWGNLNYNYAQGTMGLSGSDFGWINYQLRGWNDPHVVGYMESHDEERLMYKNLTYGNSANPYYNVKDLNTALHRMEMAGAFFFTIPGPKMIWQFGELGYDYSIDYGCRLCNKPVRWDYFTIVNRLRLYDVWSELIKLKTTYPVFSTTDYNLSVAGITKRINLNDPEMNVTILGNFDVHDQNIYPNFQHTGTWYEYFTGDSIDVTEVNAAVALVPGEYRLYTDQKLSTPVIAVGTEDLDAFIQNNILAYPNPSGNIFNIYSVLQGPSELRIEIMNAAGEIVYSDEYATQPTGEFSFTWNATNVLPGIYFCRIISENSISTAKLVLMK